MKLVALLMLTACSAPARSPWRGAIARDGASEQPWLGYSTLGDLAPPLDPMLMHDQARDAAGWLDDADDGKILVLLSIAFHRSWIDDSTPELVQGDRVPVLLPHANVNERWWLTIDHYSERDVFGDTVYEMDPRDAFSSGEIVLDEVRWGDSLRATLVATFGDGEGARSVQLEVLLED